MAYIICEPCVGTMDTACVDVCPVDCIHPRKDEPEFQSAEMLYIHPDECIDCGVCEPECPVDAIKPDTEPNTAEWVEFNRKYSEMWPVLITKRDPMPDAEAHDGEPGKMEKYFSEAPGEGS